MLNRRAPDAVDACQVRCSGWSHADAASACQPKIVKSAREPLVLRSNLTLQLVLVRTRSFFCWHLLLSQLRK